jgi:Arc/MetJ-type ribon-helix-helix transcriptional regulator
MNIALPESLEPIVRRRVEECGYSSPDEYVRYLILRDDKHAPDWDNLTEEEQREVDRINDLLLKSLDSGPPIVADEAYWENLKKRARERWANGA